MCNSYNGWANHQTWNVALWMDNDQGNSEYWNDRATHLARRNDKLDAIRMLADELRDEHEENQPEVNGVFADLLSHALSNVEWRDIAENLLEECEFEEEEVSA